MTPAPTARTMAQTVNPGPCPAWETDYCLGLADSGLRHALGRSACRRNREKNQISLQAVTFAIDFSRWACARLLRPLFASAVAVAQRCVPMACMQEDPYLQSRGICPIDSVDVHRVYCRMSSHSLSELLCCRSAGNQVRGTKKEIYDIALEALLESLNTTCKSSCYSIHVACCLSEG